MQISLPLSKTPLQMTAYSGKQATMQLLLDEDGNLSTGLQKFVAKGRNICTGSKRSCTIACSYRVTSLGSGADVSAIQ
jgi:hypothetical protein